MEKYFYEAFEHMERLGPGCADATLKAASYMENTQPVKILDIGCGIGTHTFILAERIPNAEIIAIDNNQDFIDTFNSKANKLGLDGRVQGICMSMFEMEFEAMSFDYIFAEGSVYIAGFINALANWKKLLKENGRIICSEISWTTEQPSEEIKAFWEANYSQMNSISIKIAQAENLGYKVISHFSLPIEAWADNYYVPLAKNLDDMKKKYTDNSTALKVVSMIQQEIDLYYKYSAEYNYIFYVLQLK